MLHAAQSTLVSPFTGFNLKTHKMTLYELAWLLACYFIGLLVLIIIYGLVDMIDRKQRLEHQRKVSEEQMLINISQEPCEYEGIWIEAGQGEPDNHYV